MGKSEANISMRTITPAMAAKFMEEHEAVVRSCGLESMNRIINDNTVTQYGRDMSQGKWEPNGETVKRSARGRIVDGQHRLWACIQSDTPFETGFMDNIAVKDEDRYFVTTDIGRTKTPSAFISASGIGYGGIAAPAARLIMAYKTHKTLTKTHMITTPEVVEFTKKHSHLVDSAAFVAKYQGYAPTSTLCAWHYLMSEKSPEDAAKFIIDLKQGTGLSKGDALYAMRERLIQNKHSKTQKLNSKSVFALGLNIWNDRRRGMKRQVIKAPHWDYNVLPKLV